MKWILCRLGYKMWLNKKTGNTIEHVPLSSLTLSYSFFDKGRRLGCWGFISQKAHGCSIFKQIHNVYPTRVEWCWLFDIPELHPLFGEEGKGFGKDKPPPYGYWVKFTKKAWMSSWKDKRGMQRSRVKYIHERKSEGRDLDCNFGLETDWISSWNSSHELRQIGWLHR